jgi:pimeloyl-ACP methyl ester carboxylesterase
MPFVNAGGHALEYESIGGAGPTLVFLHEGLGSIRQWRDFPARLCAATGRPALVYNRYGYGNSDVLAERRVSVRFMHDEALVALPDLLAKLKVESPVLVGHSDGASIALIHAGARHPVRGLVVIAPHVFVEEHGLRSIERVRQQFETTDLPERLARYHRDPRRTFYLWNDAWLDPQFRHWNIEEYLPSIEVPVLAIQGTDDEYGTMAQLASIREKTKGRCESLELAACGHSPHRDQPAAVVAAIVRFLRGLG